MQNLKMGEGSENIGELSLPFLPCYLNHLNATAYCKHHGAQQRLSMDENPSALTCTHCKYCWKWPSSEIKRPRRTQSLFVLHKSQSNSQASVLPLSLTEKVQRIWTLKHLAVQ